LSKTQNFTSIPFFTWIIVPTQAEYPLSNA
jgi:hypothetical protein